MNSERNVLAARVIITILTFFAAGINLPAQQIAPGSNQFTKRIVTDGLDDPWTIISAADNCLWLTEAKGYRVLRINPEDGHRDTLIDLNSLRQFPRYDTLNDLIDGGKPWGQGGLMGMALHPDIFNGKPFVYLALIYDFEGRSATGKGKSADGGFHFLTKIIRCRYDSVSHRLNDIETVCDSIPGSNDHNGGRLLIATVNNTPYLFYSIGDMGAGQFDNGGRHNYAQDPTRYEGKILRFNVEPDSTNKADTASNRSSVPSRNNEVWIPADNPFNSGNRNAVYSIGHRNPQGLTKARRDGDDLIFTSEHGPFSDDEINIIKRGGNYGHPLVIGYADGNYNGLAAGVSKIDSLQGIWNTSYPFIKSEAENSKILKNYQEPIKSFSATGSARLTSIANRIREGKGKDPEWSSLAPSGLSFYSSSAIPGWKSSLLVTSLKHGKLVRLQLDSSLRKVIKEEDLFGERARYRDVTISSDGKKIYIVTDKSMITSGPTEKNPEKQNVQGAIIEYKYNAGK